MPLSINLLPEVIPQRLSVSDSQAIKEFPEELADTEAKEAAV